MVYRVVALQRVAPHEGAGDGNQRKIALQPVSLKKKTVQTHRTYSH